MDVVLLSQYPEFLEKCADLLNQQWKRSTSARVQSLEKSFTQLPDSLLLILHSENDKIVIGHSRLTRVLEDPNGCWIGSVVISEKHRKKGYGKYLMEKTEEYARRLQFRTVYLNTQDQQGFYEHIGYSYSEPVSSIGFSSGFPSKNFFFKDSFYSCVNQCISSEYKNNQTSNLNTAQNIPLPPPPPPLPLNSNISSHKNRLKTNLGQYWMKKSLC